MKVKVLVFTGLILVMAASAYAYQGGGCPGQKGHGHFQDFMSGLTPEQQEKVRAATDKHHEKLFAIQKELRSKEQALDALYAVTPVDKAAVQKLVGEVNALQVQKTELNAAYRLELTEITGKPLAPGSGRGMPACGDGKPCPPESRRGGYGCEGQKPCPQGVPAT